MRAAHPSLRSWDLAAVMLAVFAATIPVEAAWVSAGFGSLARVSGLIAAVVTAAVIVSTGRVRRLARADFILLLLGLAAGASFYWSVDPARTVHSLVRFGQLLLLYLLVRQTARDEGRIGLVLAGLVIGACVAVVTMIATGMSEFSSAASDFRLTAFGADVNTLGVVLAIAAMSAVYLASCVGGVARIVLATGAIGISAGVMLTGSRGALLALACGYAVLLYAGLREREWSALVALVISLALLLVVMKSLGLDIAARRFQEFLRDPGGGTAALRVFYWQTGLAILATSPFLGHGFGTVPALLTRYVGPAHHQVLHNTVLDLGVELGILGLVPYLFVLAEVLGRLSIRGGRPAVFALAIFVVWLVGSLTLTLHYEKITWLVLGVLVSFAALK